MPKIKVICQMCGVIFERYNRIKSIPKYCSIKCFQIGRHNNQTLYKKECTVCHKTFISKREESTFCSLQCLGKNRKKGVPRKCIFCGKSFYKQPSHKGIYCSKECYTKDHIGKVIKCKRCGKEFRRDILMRNIIFCSKKCRDTRPFNGEYKGCLICGKEFYVCPSHIKGTFYCSRACRLKSRSSSIERTLSKKLINMGLPIVQQYKVFGYWIDIAIPDIKIAIECDGDYWHSLSENINRDKRKTQHLNKEGWTLLRFSESFINDDLQYCVNQIISTFNLAIQAKLAKLNNDN